MPVDWTSLQRCADRQHGVLSRGQCLAAGLDDEFLQWRVRSRRWVRLHPGVYLTKPGKDGWKTTAMAALLAVQSDAPAADAAFRGDSAAHWWGIRREPPDAVHLVVPERRRPAEPDGAALRRSSRWATLVDDREYPWRTTLPVTVLDLAASGSPVDALAVVARAVQKRQVTTAELVQELRARGGHRHSAILRPALADVDDGTESAAEVLYVRDVERAHGLPVAVRQRVSRVGDRRVHDNYYEAYRLMVEVDGRLGHERWSDRVRDGRRDRLLLTQEEVTTRVFWADVGVTPCDTAGEIGAILRVRGWDQQPQPCRRAGCSVGARVFGGLSG